MTKALLLLHISSMSANTNLLLLVCLPPPSCVGGRVRGEGGNLYACATSTECGSIGHIIRICHVHQVN